jgi:hypothetical protein
VTRTPRVMAVDMVALILRPRRARAND